MPRRPHRHGALPSGRVEQIRTLRGDLRRLLLQPEQILRRVRWLFLIFAAASALVGVAVLSAGHGWQTWSVKAATAAALVSIWMVGYQWDRPFPGAELVEAVALLVLGSGVQDPAVVSLVLFPGILFRSLNSSARSVARVAACYVAALAWIGRHDLATVASIPSAIVMAVIVHVLAGMLAEHDDAAARETALLAVGDMVLRAAQGGEVHRAVLRQFLAVAGVPVSGGAIVLTRDGVPQVVASVWLPEGTAMRSPTVTLSPPPASCRSSRALKAVIDVLAELQAPDEVPTATPRPIERDGTVIVPMGAYGRWIGAVALECADALPSGAAESLMWLASRVAVVLDARSSGDRVRALVRHASEVFTVVSIDTSVGTDGVVGTDTVVVRYQSPSAQQEFGYEEGSTIGRPLRELVHEDDLPELLRAVADPGSAAGSPVSARWRRADGTWRATESVVADLRDDPAVEGIVLTTRDVTERKQLEVELRHAQKLEAVGQLAGGVAHEINTPVQFIGDNLQFLDRAFASLIGLVDEHRRRVAALGGEATGLLDEPDLQVDLDFLRAEVPSALSQALDGTRRVAGIVRALKSLGHPDRGIAVPTDVNEAVRNTVTVARSELKFVADVVEDLGEVPDVLAVPGDIGQVFLNLLVNAAHAVGDAVVGTGRRGRITVSTRIDGADVVVTVADDGTGIPPEVGEHVFEPFFTTKEVGRGTGQGLALARAVVEQHGGSISFESAVGVGTTFVVRLPRGGPSAVSTATRPVERCRAEDSTTPAEAEPAFAGARDRPPRGGDRAESPEGLSRAGR